MLKQYCDICGKETDAYRHFFSIEKRFSLLSYIGDYRGVHGDICDECYDSLMKFVDQRKNKCQESQSK